MARTGPSSAGALATIRSARADEIDQIASLERRFFPSEALSRRQIAYYRKRGTAFVLVAIDSHRNVAGYVVSSVTLVRGARVLRIISVGVKPSHRRRGIGRRLLRIAISRARKAGAVRATLEVSMRNRGASSLYRSLGLKMIQRHIDYYAKGKDAFVMEKQIA